MNRRAVALAMATALALAFAVAVVPGVAYAVGPVVQISPQTGPPGTIIRVAGTGFCAAPCGPVRIAVGSFPVGDEVPITLDGRFGVEVRVPETAREGEVPVVASQRDANGVELVGRTVFVVMLGAPTRVQPPVGPSGVTVSTLPQSPSTASSAPAISSPTTAAAGGAPAPNYPGLAIVALVAAVVIAAFLTLARRVRRQPAG
jgi:hypothetical protein